MQSPPKSQVIIVRARTSQARGYAFLPVYSLNLAWFRQGGERAEMSLSFQLHPW
jgi:hypothetical protein